MIRNTPDYLIAAFRDVGLSETKGTKHNRRIVGWLEMLGAWWRDDETPWCGVALAAWMRETANPYPKEYYRAKQWADYGEACGVRYGAIAVLERKGGGHVGIVTGISNAGKYIRLIGGNQNDMVKESWFDAERVTAYRKRPGDDLSPPPLAKVGELSKSEA